MILLGPPNRITSTINAEELHRFAEKIGLKLEWYKKLNEDGSIGYYDITSEAKIRRALRLGVEVVEDEDDLLYFWKLLIK